MQEKQRYVLLTMSNVNMCCSFGVTSPIFASIVDARLVANPTGVCSPFLSLFIQSQPTSQPHIITPSLMSSEKKKPRFTSHVMFLLQVPQLTRSRYVSTKR